MLLSEVDSIILRKFRTLSTLSRNNALLVIYEIRIRGAGVGGRQGRAAARTKPASYQMQILGGREPTDSKGAQLCLCFYCVVIIDGLRSTFRFNAVQSNWRPPWLSGECSNRGGSGFDSGDGLLYNFTISESVKVGSVYLPTPWKLVR